MEASRTARFLGRFGWYRRSRLWVVPGLGMGAAFVLAAITIPVDLYLLPDDAPVPVFSGAEDTARSMMSLVGTSIATLTALVLTIVAVVLQLATQSLSPRAVRTFLQDPKTHLTLGLFVLTFTYALVVLQLLGRLHDVEEDGLTSLSVTVVFVLAVACIGTFILYVDHIVHQARVTSVIARVGDRARREIERQYPDGDVATAPPHPSGEPTRVVRSARSGHVLEIDVEALLEAVGGGDLAVVLVPSVGDFIPTGAPLFELYGDTAASDDDLVATAEVDAERSITQDVLFGMRLLVDIAERALSPGVNDPTTAVQAIDRLHDVLRTLGVRPFPTGWHGGQQGEPRLLIRQPPWETFVALAFEEVRHYGQSSLQVVRRIRRCLEDLLEEVPDERRPALHRQLRLLDDVIEQGFDSELERAAARHPDAQGIGSGGGFAPDDGDTG